MSIVFLLIPTFFCLAIITKCSAIWDPILGGFHPDPNKNMCDYQNGKEIPIYKTSNSQKIISSIPSTLLQSLPTTFDTNNINSIKQLQSFLQTQKIYKGKIDGKLGTSTINALLTLQKTNNINVEIIININNK